MRINGFQFTTEPKVSFYAPEDKSYNFELLKKIRQVLHMIKEIKNNNVEKGDELEKELKEIVGVKNETYYDQLNMGDKIDEMYERVSIIYNGQPLRSKIIEQIELNTEYFKNNLSSITVAEILKIIESIDNNIGQLLELNDIVDMSKLFDEFRALCISIYYRKKDGNVQNDSVFQELIGDFNTKLALDTYISELNINDKEYKRIRANSDDIEYLENPEIWKIVSDHLGVPILAESEVVTEDNNNILADNNNTSLAIPNNQRRSLVYSILVAIQQNFINVISSLFKNSSEVDKSNTETLEFWKDLDFDRLISLVSDKFKIEFERERLEKEGIPERVQLPDTKIFKPSNEEIIYKLLEEAVNKKNGFEYIDKNGIYKDITKDAFYRCFFTSSGKTIETIIFKYKSCLMFPTLTYIYEIGRLIGTMNGLDKCIEELIKGKKIHFSEIERDDYGNKKPSAYSSIFKYAEKSWERVKDKLKSPAFHDIIGKAEIDRKEHYNRILGKDSKGLIGSLKVKPENMIHVGTLEPPENIPIKLDDHEH